MIDRPPPLPLDRAGLLALRDRWAATWPGALEVWSRFTRLREPLFCLTEAEAKAEGLTGSFAMIRFVDQSIVVSLPAAVACRVEGFALEVLAHEIGHHVLAPATLTDHARCLARMRWSLPTVEQHAPMAANLYTDLLINDRLQRGANVRESEVYRAMAARGTGGAVWTLYLRMYEILWSLERGSLGGGAADDRLEGDAWLGARLVRSYAREWLDGAGRFAALLLPHLLEDQHSADLIQALLDTHGAGAGGQPAGLTDLDPGEREGAVHPALDPELSGLPAEETAAPAAGPPREAAAQPAGRGQARQPFEYGEILRAAGVDLSDHDVAVRYYRERALPHLVRYPSRELPRGDEPLPEGLETWDIGQPLEAADWLQSVLQSPLVVPGATTVQRVYGTTESETPRREPFDLDLYVDSSGSMANPQRLLSFPTLAGAVVCLSALRAGARVQATLWSGKRQFTTTAGFGRDEEAVLRVLTGYFGGGTAFPLHVLRDTFARRRGDARPAHILVVSDDGASTMFDTPDEQGRPGREVAAEALGRARGGGTLALQLAGNWEDRAGNYPPYAELVRARDEGGWAVERVGSWDDLLRFAREFSRRQYGKR